MFDHFLIFDPFYLQNFAFIVAFLILIGTPLYFLRNKSVYYQASWSSVVSWFYVLPAIFIFFALPEPGPLIILGLMSIYSLKTFFK